MGEVPSLILMAISMKDFGRIIRNMEGGGCIYRMETIMKEDSRRIKLMDMGFIQIQEARDCKASGKIIDSCSDNLKQ